MARIRDRRALGPLRPAFRAHLFHQRRVRKGRRFPLDGAGGAARLAIEPAVHVSRGRGEICGPTRQRAVTMVQARRQSAHPTV